MSSCQPSMAWVGVHTPLDYRWSQRTVTNNLTKCKRLPSVCMCVEFVTLCVDSGSRFGHGHYQAAASVLQGSLILCGQPFSVALDRDTKLLCSP